MLQDKLHVFCCPFFRAFGSLNPGPISDQKIVIFHTLFRNWGPFLESPGNLTGPELYF